MLPQTREIHAHNSGKRMEWVEEKAVWRILRKSTYNGHSSLFHMCLCTRKRRS